MNIQQVADAAGLSRRAVRFYVQRGLLPPPAGAGRGSHYTAEHVERLNRIRKLQSAGHSLDAIGRLLELPADAAEAAAAGAGTDDVPPPVRTRLMARVSIIEGVELEYDCGRHSPSQEALAAAKDAIARIFSADANRANNNGERRTDNGKANAGD